MSRGSRRGSRCFLTFDSTAKLLELCRGLTAAIGSSEATLGATKKEEEEEEEEKGIPSAGSAPVVPPTTTTTTTTLVESVVWSDETRVVPALSETEQVPDGRPSRVVCTCTITLAPAAAAAAAAITTAITTAIATTTTAAATAAADDADAEGDSMGPWQEAAAKEVYRRLMLGFGDLPAPQPVNYIERLASEKAGGGASER